MSDQVEIRVEDINKVLQSISAERPHVAYANSVVLQNRGDGTADVLVASMPRLEKWVTYPFKETKQ